MRRHQGRVERANLGFPRVSGDAPMSESQPMKFVMFSPRERGCARYVADVALELDVFPA